ncbi:MAG: hypothetical protein ACRDNW_10140 [Trebonia sp.]
MRISISRTTRRAHPSAEVQGEVEGIDRLRGRTHDELFDALSWLAWYRLGTFTTAISSPSRRSADDQGRCGVDMSLLGGTGGM